MTQTLAPERPATLQATRRVPRPTPFHDAQEAWFWTMAALVARRERTSSDANRSGPARPVLPEDVLRCLDRLYRQRRIDLLHARVLRRWGERGVAPDILRPGERGDARIWREAMDRLEGSLRIHGIVGSGPGD